jgi:hypothetical protein
LRRKTLGEKTRPQRRIHKPGESIITAVSVGTVFILIGAVFVLALPANLWERILDFFRNFGTRQVPGTSIYLPAPMNPNIHTVVYSAAFQFCVGLAILQIITLSLRILFRSTVSRIAETMGNLVFWFGTAYMVLNFLNSSTGLRSWFTFWAGILIIIGISLIARALVMIARR